ncbi:hypothetical protein, partial [Asticcacaulis sp.]|uniref:hypothetical protein n=1 Tax=Asticcacaulis sp. TaxID=1872648 RepID=UPI002602B2EA
RIGKHQEDFVTCHVFVSHVRTCTAYKNNRREGAFSIRQGERAREAQLGGFVVENQPRSTNASLRPEPSLMSGFESF